MRNSLEQQYLKEIVAEKMFMHNYDVAKRLVPDYKKKHLATGKNIIDALPVLGLDTTLQPQVTFLRRCICIYKSLGVGTPLSPIRIFFIYEIYFS